MQTKMHRVCSRFTVDIGYRNRRTAFHTCSGESTYGVTFLSLYKLGDDFFATALESQTRVPPQYLSVDSLADRL